MSPPFSRRGFLTTAVGASVGLAGCASGPAEEEDEGTQTPGFDSVVSDVTVTKRDVVLELASTNVSEATLIGPDGTAFDRRTVQTGERTVRFQIIELDLWTTDYSHYPVGAYEIFVSTDDEEFSQSLSLVPDLQIRAVEQYRDGERSSDLSKIGFTVENVGTGPTWVYDVAFDGSPNFTVNGNLNAIPSIPYLVEPTTRDELLLAPNEEQQYVDDSRPLAPKSSEYSCQDMVSPFTSRVGVADGSVLDIELQPTLAGESISLGYADRFVCTETEIDWTATGEFGE